jgi:hypothetical protein
MTEPEPSANAEAPAHVPAGPGPAPRALTRRAMLVGALCTAGVAVATPINDWVLNNTLLFGNHLPLVVTLLALVFGLAVNPLLGARRFQLGELVVIASMMLALGGVASSGLMRVFPGVLAGPAHVLPVDPALAPLGTRPGEPPKLASGLFVGIPERGPIQPSDPEYRLVVDGYFNGLGKGAPRVGHRAAVTWSDAAGEHRATAVGGEAARALAGAPGWLDLDSPLGRALTGAKAGDQVAGPDGPIRVLAVSAPGIPWRAWIGPCLRWLPLLAAGLLCCLAIAALVRKQWIEHERLPFPIAQVTLAFLEPAPPGERFARLYRDRGFWIAFLVPAVVFTTQGLRTWGLLPLSIPTELDFRPAFAGEPWTKVWDNFYFFDVHVYFSVLALAFFMTLDISFSLWFFFVLTNLGVMALRNAGVPVSHEHPVQAGSGGYAVECLLILWIGRHHYGRLLRAALAGSRDPELRAAVPWVWALLLSCAAMVLWLVAAGAMVGHAALVVLLFLGFILVLARLVAEAGVPHLGAPSAASLTQTVFSVVGFHAPITALAPLVYVGSTLLADQRELLLPYALHTQYLADRAGIRGRWRLGAVMAAVLLVGGALACATMIWASYTGSGHPDWFWSSNLISSGLVPLATGWQNEGVVPNAGETWLCYGIGALITAALGIARLFISGWPFHPLGYIASMPWPTCIIWFSFFLGWLAKFLVMRYGGVGLYQRLKPAALGLIAGEAGIAGAFLAIEVVLHLLGHDPSAIPRFLPQ